MGRLTETEYQSRRIKLLELIYAGRRAYVDAAYQVEMGEGKPGDAAKERTRIEDLEARLAGLDAARQKASAAEMVEQEEISADARAKAAATFVSLLDRRLNASREMSAAVEALITAWKAKDVIESTARDMLEETMHLGEGLNGSNSGSMTLIYQSLTYDFAGPFIAGRLAREGHNLESINWNTASNVNGDTVTLDGRCDDANSSALAQVSRHLPEVWKMHHGDEQQLGAISAS